MLEFEKLFPQTTTIILTKNYRNPPNILQTAEALIKQNSLRFEKILEPDLDKDGALYLWEMPDVFHQYEAMFHLLEKYIGSTSAMTVADEIEAEAQGYSLADIAILYRTQRQGKLLAEQLAKKGYPYQISNAQYFWEQEEIKTFIFPEV